MKRPADAKPRDPEAVAQGWDGFCKSLDSNPYPDTDPRHEDWEYGWGKASEEA